LHKEFKNQLKMKKFPTKVNLSVWMANTEFTPFSAFLVDNSEPTQSEIDAFSTFDDQACKYSYRKWSFPMTPSSIEGVFKNEAEQLRKALMSLSSDPEEDRYYYDFVPDYLDTLKNICTSLYGYVCMCEPNLKPSMYYSLKLIVSTFEEVIATKRDIILGYDVHDSLYSEFGSYIRRLYNSEDLVTEHAKIFNPDMVEYNVILTFTVTF